MVTTPMKSNNEQYITVNYKNLNNLKHKQVPTWGTTSAKYEEVVAKFCKSVEAKTALDYGCGKGKLNFPEEVEVRRYDPAIEEYQKCPENPADLVTCIDVMEHVEAEFVGPVLDHISKLTSKKAFFVISTRLAHHKLPNGWNTHRTVRAPDWWLSRLKRLYKDVDVVHQRPDELHVLCGT